MVSASGAIGTSRGVLGTFGRAWAVELRKVAATPSLVVGLAIGIAATPLAALVVADRSDAAESMTAVRLAVSAAMIPVVAFALWGAYATTSEYERGAIVGSLLAVPRRSSFYTAKLAAVATVVGVAMTLSAAVAVVVVGLAAPPPGLAVGPWWAVPVIGLIPPDLDFDPNPDEVEAWFEVPLSFLLDPANATKKKVDWAGQTREYYDMQWQDRRIWGVTAGIIANLARRLEDGRTA